MLFLQLRYDKFHTPSPQAHAPLSASIEILDITKSYFVLLKTHDLRFKIQGSRLKFLLLKTEQLQLKLQVNI